MYSSIYIMNNLPMHDASTNSSNISISEALRAAWLPEKMRELIASLYFLLVYKILRRIINGNKDTELIAVYIWIACAHCKLIGRMKLPGKLSMSIEICGTI